MNILFYILLAVMGLVAGLSCIILLLGMPVVIGWKIYRKIRYGISITD